MSGARCATIFLPAFPRTCPQSSQLPRESAESPPAPRLLLPPPAPSSSRNRPRQTVFTSGSMMTSACWRQAISAWRWMMVKERLMTSAAVRGVLQISGFQIDGDDDVRAEQQASFDGHRRGQKAVDQRAAFELNGHEQAGIRAGAAQRRTDRSARVVNGDAGIDVGGSDGQRRGELLESFSGREAREIPLEAKIVGQAEPGRRPAAEVRETWWPWRCAACRRAARRRNSTRRSARRRWFRRRNRWERRRFVARESRRCARSRGQSRQPGPGPRGGVRLRGVFPRLAKARILSVACCSQSSAWILCRRASHFQFSGTIACLWQLV